MAKLSTHFVFVSVLLFVLCSWNVAGENFVERDTPLRAGPNVRGLTMNILYCYSCGYKKVFDDYASIIQQKFPDISVYGANYDPPGINMYLSRFVGIAKMLLIACVMSGFNIFAFLNKPQPSWWQWCIENKMYSCMMLFFLCNIIEGQLVSSGAFEIYLNDMPIWSKLETGRIPQPPELFQIVEGMQGFYNVDNVMKSGPVK